MDTLPDEILTVIFSFLHPRDVCGICARVCKSWNDRTQEPQLWRIFCQSAGASVEELEDTMNLKDLYLELGM